MALKRSRVNCIFQDNRNEIIYEISSVRKVEGTNKQAVELKNICF